MFSKPRGRKPDRGGHRVPPGLELAVWGPGGPCSLALLGELGTEFWRVEGRDSEKFQNLPTVL